MECMQGMHLILLYYLLISFTKSMINYGEDSSTFSGVEESRDRDLSEEEHGLPTIFSTIFT